MTEYLPKYVTLGIGLLITVAGMLFFKNVFGALFDGEKEQVIIKSSFWKVVHVQKRVALVSKDDFYRLYALGGKAGKSGGPELVVIKPPLLEEETSDFHAVIHPNTSDSFFSECMVIIVERYKDEGGYTKERMRSFWVKNSESIRSADR
jgi:hypothetical protein